MILIDDTVAMLHDGFWAAENYDVATISQLRANSLFTEKLLLPSFADSLIAELMRPMRRP